MTTFRTLAIALAITACGGGSKKAAEQPKTDTAEATPSEAKTEAKPEEKEPAPPPEPPKPPPPKMWHAKADLTPTKASKMKPASVTLSQEEGKPTAVAAASIDGLKPGKYHLMVHEAKDCGTNATKAGKVMASSADVGFEVKKGTPGSVDESGAQIALGGDDSVVGHALVLHDDAKGKPGKAVACGVITAVDEDDAAKKE